MEFIWSNKNYKSWVNTSVIFPKDQSTLNHFPPMENSLEAKEARDKTNISKSLNIFCLYSQGGSCPLSRDYACTLNITMYEYWNNNTKKVVQTHKWMFVGIPFRTTDFLPRLCYKSMTLVKRKFEVTEILLTAIKIILKTYI